MFLRRLYNSYFPSIRSDPSFNQTRTLFIASIGNPEPEYKSTRHNVGHRMMDQLVDIYWKQHLIKRGDYYYSSKYPNIVLFKSVDSYMNLQGKPISKHFSKYNNNTNKKLIILHDELQVDLGKYQIRKPGTSERGHNGLKSINQYMKNDYYKISIGIGRPNDRNQVTDHVLSKFNDREMELLDFEVLPKCVEELEKLIKLDLNSSTSVIEKCEVKKSRIKKEDQSGST
ncbi:uncharacterized protein J8A68_000388 [[Candida] subhashii]|uniref:Peptidyl-tRNA hydrolase n=1 Tax=[Candida] subhashii TaxID=561895 RepID=A0A8J5QT85_9ASCO|nr:uncharacterized protein J8A68_000388 [[Candida] subhashii]KAG7666131.1 hypothetical protein J8A68_000388 [[Candida] subhashii]